jgi:hypothetical protein
VRVVWDSLDLSDRGSTWAVDPRDALARAVVESRSFEDAVVLVDWAREAGVVTDDDDAAEVLSRLRADAAGLVAWSEGGAESILESAAGTRFRRAGHHVVRQVRIEGTRKMIDMVVDGIVGLETDGRTYHVDRFEQDRAKDSDIARSGRIPFRASAEMVRDEWRSTEGAVVALIHTAGGARPVAGGGTSSLPRVLGPRGRRRWRLAMPRRGGGREAPKARC